LSAFVLAAFSNVSYASRVDADIGDGTSLAAASFAHGSRAAGNAHGLDRGIDTPLTSQLHDRVHHLAVAVVDGCRGAKLLCHCKAVVVEIDAIITAGE